MDGKVPKCQSKKISYDVTTMIQQRDSSRVNKYDVITGGEK